MFTKILQFCRKVLNKPPKSLGESLKALKKNSGVIDDLPQIPGSRFYRCKHGRILHIFSMENSPTVYFDLNSKATRVERSSTFNIDRSREVKGFYQDTTELLTEFAYERNREYTHCKSGLNTMDITNKKEQAGIKLPTAKDSRIYHSKTYTGSVENAFKWKI